MLDALPEVVRARAASVQLADMALPQRPTGAITAEKLGTFIAEAIPENAIVVDESITTGWNFNAATVGARPHDWINVTGGSIGWAMPVALGAAIACPTARSSPSSPTVPACTCPRRCGRRRVRASTSSP